MVTSAEMLPLIVGQIAAPEAEEIIEDAEPVEEPVEVVDTIELPDTDSNKTTANADAPPADFVVDDGVVDVDDEERKKDAT